MIHVVIAIGSTPFPFRQFKLAWVASKEHLRHLNYNRSLAGVMQTDQGYLPLEKAVDEHKIITDH